MRTIFGMLDFAEPVHHRLKSCSNPLVFGVAVRNEGAAATTSAFSSCGHAGRYPHERARVVLAVLRLLARTLGACRRR
jgi:hypothetical protein